MKQAFAEDGLDLGRLKNGNHQYSWSLDAEFFKAFEGSLIQDGEMNAMLNLERVEHVFRANLQIDGKVKTACDACLSHIEIPFQNELDFVIRLSSTYKEDDLDNEVFYVMESNPRFYVSQHIYDLVNLSLPLRKTCEDPGNTDFCNTEILNKMNNEDMTTDDSATDPRWDKLKDLLN